MASLSTAVLLCVGGCYPHYSLRPAAGGAVAVAAAGGISIVAHPDAWDAEPDELQDYLTPIAVTIHNRGNTAVVVNYADFVLVDEHGYRYRPIALSSDNDSSDGSSSDDHSHGGPAESPSPKSPGPAPTVPSPAEQPPAEQGSPADTEPQKEDEPGQPGPEQPFEPSDHDTQRYPDSVQGPSASARLAWVGPVSPSSPARTQQSATDGPQPGVIYVGNERSNMQLAARTVRRTSGWHTGRRHHGGGRVYVGHGRYSHGRYSHGRYSHGRYWHGGYWHGGWYDSPRVYVGDPYYAPWPGPYYYPTHQYYYYPYPYAYGYYDYYDGPTLPTNDMRRLALRPGATVNSGETIRGFLYFQHATHYPGRLVLRWNARSSSGQHLAKLQLYLVAS